MCDREKEAGRKRQTERPDLLIDRAGVGDALDDLVGVRAGVGDDRRAEVAWRVGQDARQHGLGGAAQQQAELGGAIEVEQHELAAVRRQQGIEARNHRPRAHREVATDWNVRIGGRRSSLPCWAAVARRSCSATVRRCDWRAPLTGKRIVLEGIELGHDAEPRRLGEGGKHRRQSRDTGKAREGRDADHRRDQDQAVGPRQALVVDGVESVFHRQRAAVGEAHDMERPRRAARRRASRTASRVAASQSSHSTSVKAAGTVPCPGILIATATKPRSR